MTVLERNNVTVTGNQSAAQTMVFAHGFGTDQRVWQTVASAFADDFRLVLFDYVGANEKTVSTFNPARYRNFYAFADDLLDIMEVLQLQDVLFVGHSAGSMTGFLAATQEPQRFAKIIALNASPCYVNQEGYSGGFDESDLTELFAQMASNFNAWASGFAPIVMGNADRPQLAEYFARTLQGMRPDVALASAKTLFRSDHRAEMPQVGVPVLLIQARHDAAVPTPVSEYLRDHIPHSRLEIIDTEGHFPHISDPDRVISLIRAEVSESLCN